MIFRCSSTEECTIAGWWWSEAWRVIFAVMVTPPPLLVADFLPRRQEDLEGHGAPPLLDSAYFTTETLRARRDTEAPPLLVADFLPRRQENLEGHGAPPLMDSAYFTREILRARSYTEALRFAFGGTGSPSAEQAGTVNRTHS